MKMLKKQVFREYFTEISVLIAIVFLFLRYMFLDEKTISSFYIETLWFCTFVGWVYIIGVFLKKKELINAILIGATVAHFLWIIDLFLELLGLGLGRTGNMMQISLIEFLLVTITHLITIPITFIYSYYYKFSKKSYFYAVVLLCFFLLTISFTTTDFQENVNCIQFSCDLNFENDSEVILENKLFGTWQYFFMNIIFWSTVSFFSYWFYRILFKKLGKLE